MLEAPGQSLSNSIYCKYLAISIPISDPIVFVLKSDLLISKKEECAQYVFLRLCFQNNNFVNTSFILAQVTETTKSLNELNLS